MLTVRTDTSVPKTPKITRSSLHETTQNEQKIQPKVLPKGSD